MAEITRKLATAKRIEAISAIPGADSIELATVGGWKSVVKKGDFKPGDIVVYCEIDSFIPHEVAPFLTKGSASKSYKGVEGNRLKTVRLRGQLSQGLILNPHRPLSEDEDLTDELGILKWEKEISGDLVGVMKGNFPSFVPKTDQERVQNLGKYFNTWVSCGASFEVTEKLEGSSMTVYIKDGVFGVCSRNMDLLENDSNTYWQAAKKLGLQDKLQFLQRENPVMFDKGIAVQGELIGPKIQGNYYGLTEPAFYVFDVYAIGKQRYCEPWLRHHLVEVASLKHVPILFFQGSIFPPYSADRSMDTFIRNADGKSQLGTVNREGLVYKSEFPGGPTFKVISNAYLLNQE